MKKLIAKRKLKRCCSECMTSFSKGSIYYKERIVTQNQGIVLAYEYLICPKCKYKLEQHENRYKEFQKRCNHPKKFIDTEWHYISGECIKEPYYDFCRICGEILY